MKRMVILAVLVGVAMAGCGGSKKPVPNVVGERLDVAEADVRDAGYKPEVIGGGAFGVLVQSNWTVCQQRPAAGTSAGNGVELIIDRVCPSP